MSPEALARQQIDAQLVAAGWIIQDYKAVDFSAGRGIALRGVPLKTGPCDYLLLVDRHAVRTDLFPGRNLVPKTLIFAKDDSHAEDIVFIVRNVFGRGNDFAKKVNWIDRRRVSNRCMNNDEAWPANFLRNRV